MAYVMGKAVWSKMAAVVGIDQYIVKLARGGSA
jgi:hypothetical protein